VALCKCYAFAFTFLEVPVSRDVPIAIYIRIWPEPDSTRYQTNYLSGTGIGYLNTCCIAIFCFRLYEWPLTVKLSKKLEAAHHRWLRGSFGITWRDKVTYEDVQKRTGQIRLEKEIRERRMRWLGHVTRMDEVRIPEEASFTCKGMVE